MFYYFTQNNKARGSSFVLYGIELITIKNIPF